MAPKRSADTAGVEKAKRKRSSLTLEVKLDILKRKEQGEGTSALSRNLGLAQSTVWTVLKNREAIKKAGENATHLQSKLLTKHRQPIMDKMERLLKIWIDDQNRQNMGLSLNLICQKALSIIERLKVEMGVEDFEFKASKGWFHKFRRRSTLQNIKVTGEAASSDKEAADNFKPELEKCIEEKGYSKKQVIIYDETGLYWKRMTSKTYIDKEEKSAKGFKDSKDRLTLLLGGNAEGDLKLKPLLIYHSENPRALKGLLKQYLPVVWKSNPKAWLTTSIHQDYFTSYLSPTLKEYASANNIANRFLLIVDNAPSHPRAMEDWAENIEVIFLPPNTTALIQPMDQAVFKTFKAYYQRRTMQQLIKGTDGPGKPTIREWWKSYNIKHALDNIRSSWDEVKTSTMNLAWKKVWPECAHDFTGFAEDDIGAIRNEIVNLCHRAGFDGVDDDDVQDLLESHAEPLSNDELIELDKALQEAEKEGDEEEPERGLDIKTLRECLGGIEKALETLKERDPNPARSSKVAHDVEKSVKIYQEIYDEKRRNAKYSHIVAQKDVQELRTLVASASRKRVQDMLSSELRRMEIEVTQLQEAAVSAANLQQQQRPKSSTPTTYTVNIRNYSWDQSDKFTKLYLTLKNVQGLAKEAVTSSFTEKGVEVKVEGLDGKNHHLRITNLAAVIKPDASYHKVKTDMVMVLLAKAETGCKWYGVTAEDVKANQARQPKTNPSDPNSGVMDLMKQMYDEGDDKMKQMLNKTWYESQQKTLRGESPGLPDMNL